LTPVTEQEWLALEDPRLLDYELSKRIPDRKFWLYGAACCQTVWHLLGEPAQQAVGVVGMVADGHFGYADGAFDSSECKRCEQMIHHLLAAGPDAASGGVVANSVVSWALNLGYVAVQKVILCSQNASHVSGTPLRFYADLLHCLVGNPFRSVPVDPAWLTSNVIAIATDIYAERAFARLPILGDALVAAGCRSDELLGHVRSPGPHDRGCWAVDVVLGRHETGRYISRSP
jgi:hypothetical protein